MCIYSGLTRGIISKNSDTNKTNMQKNRNPQLKSDYEINFGQGHGEHYEYYTL